MLKLCDLKDASQSVWLVAPKVTIGRASACDLTIADEAVAKVHAEVAVEGDELILRNLAGPGLVAVNGKPVDGACKLRCDDQVQIGGRTLAVVDPKRTKLKAAAAGTTVSWALRANHPAIAGRVFPVRESSVVGRSEECDITFSMSHLSRRHARLEIRDGLLFVIDLGSANGTYLNNKRITESRIRRGDELRFDSLSFSVVGPSDDLDQTTVRPALAVQQVKPPVRPIPMPVELASARFQVESAIEPRDRSGYENGGELAEGGGSGWVWMVGLILTAAAAGYFWASNQGLL
jgi:pSer/pThr/pTyr-binding forkhead associated (FHA) protein